MLQINLEIYACDSQVVTLGPEQIYLWALHIPAPALFFWVRPTARATDFPGGPVRFKNIVPPKTCLSFYSRVLFFK